MTIYKIGITGHRPHKFSNIQLAQSRCQEITLEHAAKHTNIEFNLGGCIGADSWVAACCMQHSIPFNLFLPFPSQVQAKYWTAEEEAFLKAQIEKAQSVDIVQTFYSKAAYHIRDRNIVDNSDMIICFLEDFKSGTYSTVKYALSCNKIVLNGLANTFISK